MGKRTTAWPWSPNIKTEDLLMPYASISGGISTRQTAINLESHKKRLTWLEKDASFTAVRARERMRRRMPRKLQGSDELLMAPDPRYLLSTATCKTPANRLPTNQA